MILMILMILMNLTRRALSLRPSLPRAALLGLLFAFAAVLGTPCTAADSTPKSAAELYREAFEAMGRGRSAPDPNSPAVLSEAEWTAIAAVTTPAELTTEARAALAKLRPVLELARQASALDHCDFEPDRTRGYALLLSHLGPMRGLTRALRAEAMARISTGDIDGAIEVFGSIAGMASHASDDRILISSLVGMAIGALADDSIQVAVDQGLIDQARAQRLLEALEPVSGSDPFRCGDALEGEGELMAATISPIVDDPGKLAELMPLLPLDLESGVDSETLAQLDSEALSEQLATSMMLLDRSAEAFREPDPDRAAAILEEVETAVSDGAGGALGQVLLPSLRPVYESKRRTEAMFASRFAQLRDLASGARAPEEFANAAVNYLAAARAAKAIPAEDQRLIEAARSTHGAVEDPFKRLIVEALERHRQRVVEPILKGGAAGRCVFVRDRARAVGLVAIPPYAAGLRAAARTTLASALLRLREAGLEGVPEEKRGIERKRAAAELEAALRLVTHLSGDAAMAHSLLAHSILEEIRDTLEGIWTSPALQEEERAVLKTAIERLDRSDPLGYRKALAADRAAALSRAPGHRDDELRRLRKMALDTLDATTLFSCGVALQAWVADRPRHAASTTPPGQLADAGAAPVEPEFDCGGRDHDVILDLSDLYAQDACAAILARAQEIAAAPLFAASEIAALRGRSQLQDDPLPVLADISARSREAVSVIAALDERVKE